MMSYCAEFHIMRDQPGNDLCTANRKNGAADSGERTDKAGGLMSEHQKLRHLRREKGYSLKRLAGLSGISCSHLSEIERGLKRPSIATIERLAGALKVTPSDLWPRLEPRVFPGEKLRQAREARGLKLDEVAEVAGLAPSYLAGLERGELAPSMIALQRLTEALGITVNQLMANSKAMGEKIRWVREQLGLTQAELAEGAEVSPGLVGQIEQGKIQPSLRTIERIAEALHSTPCFLITEQDDIQSFLSALPPELRKLLLDPKVQRILYLVASLNEKEMAAAFKMIRVLKEAMN